MSCFCGNPAVVRTSWTNINPGRRFQACSQVPGCGFFVWVDPPMCARAIAISPGLLRTRNELQQALAGMVAENRRLKICLIGSWIFFILFMLM